MAPVIKLCKAAMDNQVENVTKMCAGLNVTMKADELKL